METNPDNYKNLLNTLAGMNIIELLELLNLYVEAKTGKYEDVADFLPVETLHSLEEMEEILNKKYAENVLKKLKDS